MQPYSTLEVRRFEDHDVYDNDGAYKEAVDHPTSLYPEHIPFENDASGVYDPQAIHHGNELSPSAVSEGATKTSKICGLSRRRFYLVLAIGVLVIIGAIVGGLAGGLLSRQHNSTPHPNVNILNISKLASSNSTDSNGNIHRTVFFQDTNNAIIARRWDSQNRTWETSNLTEMMRESRTPLNPLPGTPLASASRNWNAVDEVHLWFLAPDSYISSLYLASPDTKSNNDWKYDSLNDSQIRTRSGSQLAAMWQRCSAENCTGSWLVAYQTPDGDINVANASRWDSPTRAVEAKNVAANSSLGLSPKLHDDSGVDLAMLVSEAVGSGSTSDMQRAIYEGGWGLNEFRIRELPLPSPRLQFAITLMDRFAVTMQLALLPNGTVAAMWFADHQYHTVPSVKFRGGPAAGGDFTALAASEDAMLYVVAGDEVLEFEPYDAGADRSSFVFVGRVYP